MASSESMKGLFKQHTLKQTKLVQLEKVPYKWFMEMHYKGKLVTRPTLIDKANWQLSILKGLTPKFR